MNCELERGTELQPVHAVSGGKHEKSTFPEKTFGLSGVGFIIFLQSALRTKSRAALTDSDSWQTGRQQDVTLVGNGALV